MSLFFQYIGDLYESCQYVKIKEELKNYEKSTKALPKCIYKEIEYAESNVYRTIRNENIFPIRFLWLFDIHEQQSFGFETIDRSYYSPESLYEQWLRCYSDESYRKEAEKADVGFDLKNKAISLVKGCVLIGDTFIEDLIEVEHYYGKELKVPDNVTGEITTAFSQYKKGKKRK